MGKHTFCKAHVLKANLETIRRQCGTNGWGMKTIESNGFAQKGTAGVKCLNSRSIPDKSMMQGAPKHGFSSNVALADAWYAKQPVLTSVAMAMPYL